MYDACAYAAADAASPLGPLTIARRDPAEHDVRIDILFRGICHSDVHQARDEWRGLLPTVYPIVPGHEIVGRVAAVGCLVDADGTCAECGAASRSSARI
jgi:alcohol dehydrogenase (NADP+)